MIEADKQAEKEKLARKNDLFKADRVGFENILIVKNNTKETIENAIITTLTIYEFNSKSYTFIKEYSILKKNEIWKTDESKNLNINNILSYSYNFNDKIFKVHNPKSVLIEVYLKAKNSVGFVNFIKGEINSDIDASNGYNKIYRNYDYIKDFGEIKARTLTEIEKKTLGEKIHQEAITKIVKN